MTLPYDYSHCADHQGARHTPGPLSIKPANDGSGDYGIVIGDKLGLVAECYADIRHGNERALQEARANATLFAAASDLLEALRMAREFINLDRVSLLDCCTSSDGEIDSDDAAVVADYDAALAQIDGALGKALGNES